MKKRSIVYFILLLLLILITSVIGIKAQITGESVTGEATQNVGLNISIQGATAPTLTIEKIRNETYFNNNSLKIKIISTGTSVWYNLDNTGNTSLTENNNEFEGYFNTSIGSHIFYAFANNSNGTTIAKNVTFIIDLSKYNVSYEEFTWQSTKFNEYSYEEMQNLTNITLYNANYGKINFNEIINVTDDSNPYDNQSNINDYINISSNRIEINSDILPNFNKSATLTLYNLAFTNPRILIDNVVCSSSICAQNSYSGGTLNFNVTHFTAYSSEETPVVSSPESQSSTGGGGSNKEKAFAIDKENIKVSIKKGETENVKITVKNTGNQNLNINLEPFNINNLIKINESNFILKEKESKTINLEFYAKESIKTSIFLGYIKISGDSMIKEIPVTIEVESPDALFDIIISISKSSLRVAPGNEIEANIKVYELKNIGRVDTELKYSIINNKSEVIASSKETIAIENQADFIRSLHIPDSAKEGNYVFYATATYNEKTASSSQSFEIVESKTIKEKNQVNYVILITLFIILITLFIIVYEIRKIKKHIGLHHVKIDAQILKKEGYIKPKEKPERIFAKAFKKRWKNRKWH